jgi:hypothetical protein
MTKAEIVEDIDDQAPSGTILSHSGGYSNWVSAFEFARVCRAIYHAAEKRTAWLGNIRCKYVMLRIDLRGGNFIILDGDHNRIDGDDETLTEVLDLKTEPGLMPDYAAALAFRLTAKLDIDLATAKAAVAEAFKELE